MLDTTQVAEEDMIVLGLKIASNCKDLKTPLDYADHASKVCSQRMVMLGSDEINYQTKKKRNKTFHEGGAVVQKSAHLSAS